MTTEPVHCPSRIFLQNSSISVSWIFQLRKKLFTPYLEGASGEASLLVRVLPINDRDI
jgi:hypothetical protein